MQHGIFSNSWKTESGDPANEITYSIPPVSGRGRPLTIFHQVKEKNRNLKVRTVFIFPDQIKF